MTPPDLPRRSLLVGGGLLGVAALAGWTATAAPTQSGGATAATSPDAGASSGPDRLLAVIGTEASLVAAYDATLRRYPTLTGRLSQLRSDHVAHLQALRRALGPQAVTSPAPAPSEPAVPAQPAAALAALASLEERAAASAGTACVSTAAADRAVLLASICAAEQSHLVVLG